MLSLTFLLTHSTQHSPSSEANRFSASQEIPHISWNPKVHYCNHKCPPPVPILSQLDPVHTPHPTSRRSILISSSHLHLGLPSGHLHSVSSTKTLYTPLPSPIHATCSSYPILLYFIPWTISGEQYKSLSSSLCSFLHSPVNSSLLAPNIPLNTLFSNTLSPRSSFNVSAKFHIHTKQKVKQRCTFRSTELDVSLLYWCTKHVFCKVSWQDPCLKWILIICRGRTWV